MEAMYRRVQHTETALEQNSSYVSQLPNISQGQFQYNTVSHSTDAELASSQSVVPSMRYLRNNKSVQAEVEKQLAELKNLNKTAIKGRVKSLRGGPGEVFVKNQWTGHIISFHSGTHKTHPSYDDLTITKWVSGFVRFIKEGKS